MQKRRKRCIENDQIHIPYNYLQHDQWPVASSGTRFRISNPPAGCPCPSKSHQPCWRGSCLLCVTQIFLPWQSLCLVGPHWVLLLLPCPHRGMSLPCFQAGTASRRVVSHHCSCSTFPWWLWAVSWASLLTAHCCLLARPPILPL